ncbi:hypothetical protein TNCV_2154301 [Trichonephila clavipes]|nr:hypothetical protein TNCV_2154301 [Trichonephila clavipes]
MTSVQKESDPVDGETDEDEDSNNNESSKSPSNANAFPLLQTVMECVRFHILYGSHSVFGYPNNRSLERCPVSIDSDKRLSTVMAIFTRSVAYSVAAVAEWYRYRTVACLVMSSRQVPLKTRRVGQRCMLNLSRDETSSRAVVW